MDWVPFQQGTLTEQRGTLWVYLWVRWLWKVLSFGQLQGSVCPWARRGSVSAFWALSLMSVVYLPSKVTSVPACTPSEWSTWWHFLPWTHIRSCRFSSGTSGFAVPARAARGSAPCSTFIPPGTQSLKYLFWMAGEEHSSVITCSESKGKIL